MRPPPYRSSGGTEAGTAAEFSAAYIWLPVPMLSFFFVLSSFI